MIDQYIAQSELTGDERVNQLISSFAPQLTALSPHNSRLIAELALHSADEAFKTAIARVEQARALLTPEEFAALAMLAFKTAEMTFHHNFDYIGEGVS